MTVCNFDSRIKWVLTQLFIFSVTRDNSKTVQCSTQNQIAVSKASIKRFPDFLLSSVSPEKV